MYTHYLKFQKITCNSKQMLRRGRRLGGGGQRQNFDVNILTRHYFDGDLGVELIAVASMQLIN